MSIRDCGGLGRCFAIHGDWFDIAKTIPDDTFDLCICSPPYDDARTYGIGFKHKGKAWVEWALPRFEECLRTTKGLVAWVVEGKQNNFQYTATPHLLMAALVGKGYSLRRPCIYHRIGIPGSGGSDWWRNDYEMIVCAQREPGKLPWSCNTATGHPPKYSPGGDMSYRLPDGTRKPKTASRGHNAEGDLLTGTYTPPKKANPGNAIYEEKGEWVLNERSDYIHCVVGGSQMGSLLAHENEAPFPEQLVRPFVVSFCPPGGLVLDCFGGSGTTAAVCEAEGRDSVLVDIRDSQIDLIERRFLEAVSRQASKTSRP